MSGPRAARDDGGPRARRRIRHGSPADVRPTLRRRARARRSLASRARSAAFDFPASCGGDRRHRGRARARVARSWNARHRRASCPAWRDAGCVLRSARCRFVRSRPGCRSWASARSRASAAVESLVMFLFDRPEHQPRRPVGRHDAAGGFIDHRRESAIARDWIGSSAHPGAARRTSPAEGLSGGSRQNVVLARRMTAGSRIMMFDHPTRGVDVGAEEEVYSGIQDLSAQGVAIILLSDLLKQTIGCRTACSSCATARLRLGSMLRPVASPTRSTLVAAVVCRRPAVDEVSPMTVRVPSACRTGIFAEPFAIGPLPFAAAHRADSGLGARLRDARHASHGAGRHGRAVRAAPRPRPSSSRWAAAGNAPTRSPGHHSASTRPSWERSRPKAAKHPPSDGRSSRERIPPHHVVRDGFKPVVAPRPASVHKRPLSKPSTLASPPTSQS